MCYCYDTGNAFVCLQVECVADVSKSGELYIRCILGQLYVNPRHRKHQADSRTVVAKT